MEIQYIDAEYDHEKEKYYYDCPFCMEKAYVQGGGFIKGCKHIIFSYETVNCMQLKVHKKIVEIAYSFVKNNPGEFIERYNDYDWDEEDIGINEIFSFNDLVNIVENTEFKKVVPSFTVAQIVNPFIGGTYYALVNDEDLKKVDSWAG